MEKTFCDICGSRHWRREPHVFAKDEPAKPAIDPKPAPPAVPVRKPFDRKAYQHNYMREYMRRYRARHKPKPT